MSEIVIQQGSTFRGVYRWGALPIVYKTISAVTKAAPAVVTTTTNHGIPEGWSVAISNVPGMTQINAKNEPPKTEEYIQATVLSASTFELNSVNSLGFTAATPGGVVRYMTPVDLTGYTARMQVRRSVAATTPVLDLTTANGGIVIDTAAYTVTVIITAIQSAALDFVDGVYQLEMVAPDGTVTRLDDGTVCFSKEVTRT